MRRGRSKKEKGHHIDERWKPIDQDEERKQKSHVNDPSLLLPSSSPDNQDTTDPKTIPISKFIRENERELPNRRKPDGFSPKGWVRVDEPQKVGRDEVGSSSDCKEEVGERESGDGCSLDSKNDPSVRISETSESSKDSIDVVRRLEELKLGGGEPELSEEEQRINDQLQEDEVFY